MGKMREREREREFSIRFLVSMIKLMCYIIDDIVIIERNAPLIKYVGIEKIYTDVKSKGFIKNVAYVCEVIMIEKIYTDVKKKRIIENVATWSINTAFV